jgi:hypothetical protein
LGLELQMLVAAVLTQFHMLGHNDSATII